MENILENEPIFEKYFVLSNVVFFFATCVFQAMVIEGDSCPSMFGQVWVRDPNSLLWAKAYLLLKERKLYLSYKVCIMVYYWRWRSRVR